MNIHDPRPIIDYFYQWEKEMPDKVFLRQPYGATWKTLTYRQAGEEARRMATALSTLGLQPGDHIGIISKNCCHWILADLAILMGGYVSVPFYPTLTADQLELVLKKSDSKALFVGKLDEWKMKRKGVPTDVQMIRFPQYPGNAEISEGLEWDVLTKENKPLEGRPLPYLDDLWTILFTSGTTGTPKGVMHTHRNAALLAHNEKVNQPLGVMKMKDPKFFSFLPLNHVAERVAVETSALLSGASISFAESIETFAKNLQETKPTLFFAVPRIWTKFQLGVLSKLPAKGLNLLLSLPGVSGLIKKKIKKGLGLSEANVILTGASLTPENLKQWYRRLGLNLREVYGSTETLGGLSLMPPDRHMPNTVGMPVPGAKAKIDPETGEILMNVPWLMTGYYKEPELTAEVIKDGWLHSGDKGKFNSEGFLKVVGRVKDAFKTSKGEFVTPNHIEENFAKDECIEQVCVVGLGIPQPLAMVNLSEIGVGMEKIQLEKRFSDMLSQINAKLAGHEKVSTIIVANDMWSEQNKLLTPTMKVRRQAINDFYGGQFLDWHSDERNVIWE